MNEQPKPVVKKEDFEAYIKEAKAAQSKNRPAGNDEISMVMIEDTLKQLRNAKPDERSEKARRYAVTITEMEKVYAYFKTFVIDEQ